MKEEKGTNRRENYFRRLKQVQKKKGNEPLTQKEVDVLWSSLSDEKIDKKFGIKRDRRLGCIIVIIGTIIVWSCIFYLISTYR